MKKLESKDGITLIALIITIIVMVILVAVTINVALNGGIFTRAKESTEKTQIEADKESLLMAAMACIGEDGKVDFTKLNTEVSKLGFSGSNGTYSKGEYSYIVDKNTGRITLEGLSTSEDGGEPVTSINKLGRRVTYGELQYYVMSDNGDTLDLISADAIGSKKLGGKNNFDKSKTNYNNAVNILVTACKDETGLTIDGENVISIRSVGNTDVKYTSTGIMGNDSGTYTYDWENLKAASDWYTANGYNSYNLKAGDENYNSDMTVLNNLGILTPDNNRIYWMASRSNAGTDNHNVFFGVRDSDGSTIYICYLTDNQVEGIGSGEEWAVRPIVTISSSAPGLIWND